MIPRELGKVIRRKLDGSKAIILLGARQTGKTTLLKSLFPETESLLWLNGDEWDVQRLFEQVTSSRLKSLFAGKRTVVIDEAQRIADIGSRLKLITDQIPGVRLIATGSSAFELANRVNEPLTGRKWEYHLFPVSFGEMAAYHGLLEEKRLIPQRLVYGCYPEVVASGENAKALLKQLSESYLYKDILTWERVKKPDRLVKLLQALAYQIGSQVSMQELGEVCGIDRKTVEKYVTLLEQTYVIFRLPSFSRNLRNELKSSQKIYFYDNGIRNALIANFAPIENRADTGALWENWLVSQRLIVNHYRERWVNCRFWRTAQQQEVDYVEEADGRITGYEFKWNPNAKFRRCRTFQEAYQAPVLPVHYENCEEFLLPADEE